MAAEATATIQNADGIHCRPSVLIIKAVEDYEGEITVCNEIHSTDLRSVMSLMTLGLRPGDSVSVQVTGPDAESMCRRIVELFETHFDFPAQPKPPAATE